MIDRLQGVKVIGIKQCKKAINNGEGKILYVAQDVDMKLLESLLELAKQNSIEVRFIDSMRILGKMCGIDVGASATIILK